MFRPDTYAKNLNGEATLRHALRNRPLAVLGAKLGRGYLIFLFEEAVEVAQVVDSDFVTNFNDLLIAMDEKIGRIG